MTLPAWATYPGLGAPDCVTCCTKADEGCGCVANVSTVFTLGDGSYADAVAALRSYGPSSVGVTSNCIGWFARNGAAVQSGMSATQIANVLTMVPGVNSTDFFCGLTLKAGSTIAFTRSAGSGSGDWLVVSCDNTVLFGSGSVAAGTTDVWTPSPPLLDGEYILILTFPLGSLDWTIEPSDTMWVNPIVGFWDDAGTPRELEACPHLFLPPLTEFNDDWYADLTSAQSAIDDETSNCVGYAPDASSYVTFTATDGGSSLSLDGVTGLSQPRFEAWGSVNVIGGETISVAFSVAASIGVTSASAFIYDQGGNLVETLTGGSPLVSGAIPFSGRYTIKVVASSNNPLASLSVADFDITSSGDITVNTVQALYDIGLVCPARLDCS